MEGLVLVYGNIIIGKIVLTDFMSDNLRALCRCLRRFDDALRWQLLD